MKSISITLGVDLSAYATIEVPADTDLSEANLIEIAKKASDDEVFYPEWDTSTALRIVTVQDGENKKLFSDIPVDASVYDAGYALQSFLSGNTTLSALVASAVQAKIIPAVENVTYTGTLDIEGEQLSAEFEARKGATHAELDHAFMCRLAQVASIKYT